MEAIVLAGGLGTRLAPITDHIPKPMVAVAGKPFLEYLLASLCRQGTKVAVLAVSYQWEVIHEYFGDVFQEMELRYSVESEPLGTGGGARKALTQTQSREVVVVNGDTYYQVPIEKMHKAQVKAGNQITLALKPMANCSRYGVVALDGERVVGFTEKGSTHSGHINGGVAVVERNVFDRAPLPESFSLERDFFAAHVSELKIGGFVSDEFFIDIGVPHDLERAQKDLPQAVVALKHRECTNFTA